MEFSNFGTKNMGIDLGSANLRITFENNSIVLDEPTILAVDKKNNRVVATGNAAKTLLSENPTTIKELRPVKNGVITDAAFTGNLLKEKLKIIYKEFNTGKPRIFVNVPTDINEVQLNAIENVMFEVGAREVYMIDAPIASAVGAGAKVNFPIGNMVVDIGAGLTEVAVISLGEIVAANSTIAAGNLMDEEITTYLKENLNIAINKEAAENLKIEIGGAESLIEAKEKVVTGRNVATGMPYTMTVSSRDIEKAIKHTMEEIISTIITTLKQTPPELVSDIMRNGIYITGGGAHIKSIDNLIAQRTGIRTHVNDNPEKATAQGIDIIIKNLEQYDRTFESRRKFITQ